MAGNKKSFLLHNDSLDILDELTDQEAGELFKAIRNYQINEPVELSGLVRIAFSPFRNQFNRDNEKYEKLCEKNRLIAISRHATKSTKSTSGKNGKPSSPVVTKSTDNDSDNDSDNKRTIKPLSAKANPAFELFSYWCEVMGKSISTSKLTPKREKKIKDRLKQGYTFDQIKTAIFNCSNDPFSMGQNDRGKPFNDLELICRDGEKLESFLEATQSPTSNNQPQSLGQSGGDWHLPENRRIL